jgi:ABC-type nickel/cobalt efflux system permease component RcnA
MRRAVAVLLLCGLAMLAGSGVSAAHPLGNFSVNHFDALRVHQDRLDVRSVVDSAEIPTLQEPKPVDAARKCADVLAALDARADGDPLKWTTKSATVSNPPGQADLPTTRLECEFTAPLNVDGKVSLTFGDSYLADRMGWREITAAGTDVALTGDVRPDSITNELRKYPEDLLSTPLDVRTVAFSAQPGVGAAVSGAGVDGPGTGMLDRATAAFTGLVGSRDLTPLVGLLAVLLALVLGASHAALPGHGKTLMAAYLAGRRGSNRDAVLVGATVTLTHTAGVLVLGLLLSASSALAGDEVLRWLGMASGSLVAVIGGTLLWKALRRRAEDAGEEHGHGHGHGHAHGHGHGHGHGRAGLIGMGVAGGLVPSPSALVVLLGAVALGRTWFGVVLVFAYGAGMAAMLTLAGLLLIKVRDRLENLAVTERLRKVAAFTPFSTAALVLVVGLGLTTRALIG